MNAASENTVSSDNKRRVLIWRKRCSQSIYWRKVYSELALVNTG